MSPRDGGLTQSIEELGSVACSFGTSILGDFLQFVVPVDQRLDEFSPSGYFACLKLIELISTLAPSLHFFRFVVNRRPMVSSQMIMTGLAKVEMSS